MMSHNLADITNNLIFEEKSYDPEDNTYIFIDGEDDMDFEVCNYRSRKAKMTCGHTATPMSLTKWCTWLLNNGKCKFVCGKCDAEWSFGEVCKMALLTPEEKEDFEKKLFVNFRSSNNVKSCPGCKSFVERTNFSDLSVQCSICTADQKRTYMFCWQCLREWKGLTSRSDCCENDGCANNSLETLKSCPEMTFKIVEGVTGCPSFRACPTCGFIVGHDQTGCKNITCCRCKVEFCFVCLKRTKICLKTSSYFKPCSSGVAPRQTSIPEWKLNSFELNPESEFPFPEHLTLSPQRFRAAARVRSRRPSTPRPPRIALPVGTQFVLSSAWRDDSSSMSSVDLEVPCQQDIPKILPQGGIQEAPSTDAQTTPAGSS